MTVHLRPLLVGAGALALLALTSAPALAATGLALPGRPLTASSDPDAATKVTAGVYRVSIGPKDGGHRYLTYHRTMRLSTVHVSVLASENTTSGDGVSVEATDDAGDTCDTDSQSAYGPDALAFGASVDVGQAATDLGRPYADQPACVRAADLDLELGRGYSDAGQDLTVSVRIVEEAPVTDVAHLPTAIAENAAFRAPQTDGTSTSTATGTLADPEGVASSRAVTGTLRTGTAAVYRVSGVGWGQSLDAQVVTKPVPGVAFTALGVRILDPMTSSSRTDAHAGYVSTTAKAVATATAGPVRYLNRYGSSGPYLPGDYLVVVGVGPQSSPRDVPFTLKVELHGSTNGAPTYVGGADHAFVTSGTHGTGAVSAVPAGGWTPLRAGAVALLALVGVAGLGGGTVLLRRR